MSEVTPDESDKVFDAVTGTLLALMKRLKIEEGAWDGIIEEIEDIMFKHRHDIVILKTNKKPPELAEYQQGYADGDRTARAEREEEIKFLTQQKDTAYSERNKLLSFISKLYPSHLCMHPEEDEKWEKDWMHIVCVHFPDFNGSWHIHDSELGLFTHLPMKKNHWDGMTTEEKYEALKKFSVEVNVFGRHP